MSSQGKMEDSPVPKKQRLGEKEEKTTPRLSPDLWMQIAGFLCRKDFNNLKYVCKEIHQASKIPSVVPMWPNNALLLSGRVSIRDIAFSPDGKVLAILGGEGDTGLHLWDVRKGKLDAFSTGDRKYGTFVNFSLDGRFMAVGGGSTTDGLWIFTRLLEGTKGGSSLEEFDPRHSQYIPPPEGVFDLEGILWAPDSSSFVTWGIQPGCPDIRSARHCCTLSKEGQFGQWGPSFRDRLRERVQEFCTFNPAQTFKYILQMTKSSFVAQICGNRHLDSEEETEIFDRIHAACFGVLRRPAQPWESRHRQMINVIQSISQPWILYIQTDQSIIFVIEMYKEEDGSALPSFRKICQSSEFSIQNFGILAPALKEVPNLSTVACRSSPRDEDSNLQGQLQLFDFQNDTLQQASRDPVAVRLISRAMTHLGMRTDGTLQDFCFSSDGKTVVLAASRSLGGGYSNQCHIFSV